MFEKKIIRETSYIAFAILGAFIIFINTWNYGNGLTDDSINYIYSGTNLILLNGFYNYDGSVFISWPPFYSLVIFMLSLLVSNVYSLMIVFNAILYMITIFLLGKLSEKIFKSPLIKIIYIATLTFSYQLVFIYTRVLSESIFITIIVFITLLLQYKTNTTINLFIVLLLILCVLTRYMGVSVVITYLLYVIFWERDSVYKHKIHFIRPLLYSILAITPTSIWFIRNWHLTSNITSLKFNTIEAVIENMYHLFYSVSAMFIPESLNANIRISVFILVISIMIIFYFKLKIKIRNNSLFIVYCLSYVFILITISSFLKFDNISFRFTIPLYFILLFYILKFLEQISKYSLNKVNRALIWIVLLMIVIFPTEKGIKHTFINYSNGIDDFHSKKWKESETIKYIKNNLYNISIYSNSVAGIYANTGLKTNRISNYIRNDSRQSETVQIIFNNTLPGIDSIPNLLGNKSIGDSVIYNSDSYIIFRKY